MTDRRMLRAAVVGCGDISAVHLAALRTLPDVTLVAVCDSDRARAVAAAGAVPAGSVAVAGAVPACSAPAGAVPAGSAPAGVTPYVDAIAMLEREDLDVVHVCTPHAEHVPIAIAALERGVSVLTEKPVADRNDAADALIAAADASTATLGVCFQNRYNAPVRALRRMLDTGELGVPERAAATVIWSRSPAYYASRPWRGRWADAGGGVLMNQAIHTLDLAQWLLGDVVAVAGSAATRLLGDVIEVEDTAELLLTHTGGATTAFYATLAHGRNTPIELEIVTDRAVVSLRDTLTVTWADGRAPMRVGAPLAPGAPGSRGYWGVSHAALIADFLDHVRDGERFWIDGTEAAKSLRIIQRVYDHSFPDRFAPAAGRPTPLHGSS